MTRRKRTRTGAVLLGLGVVATGCSVVSAPGSAPAPGEKPADPPSDARTPPQAGAPDPARAGRSGLTVRGLWVVRYTLTDPDSVRAMVERAHQAGFNTLMVQVRGRGDAFYRPRWEPPAESLPGPPGSFDPLGLVLREAHQRGLRVHAWINTFLVSGLGPLPSSPLHVVNRRPDWLAVPRSLSRDLLAGRGEPDLAEALRAYALQRRAGVEGVYLSPAHPEVRDHLYAVATDLVERYPLNGVHFDYIRYPSPDFDYSPVALEEFRSWVRPRLSPERVRKLDASLRVDPLVYPDSLPEHWDEFRSRQIDELLERTYHGLKRLRPEVVVSAAVVPDVEEAQRLRFQNWTRWLKAGLVDAVAPMSYTTEDGEFVEWLDEALSAAGEGRRVWAGIGAFRNTFSGSLAQVRIARSMGAGGVVVFSYDWSVRDGVGVAGGPFLLRLGQQAWSRQEEAP